MITTKAIAISFLFHTAIVIVITDPQNFFNIAIKYYLQSPNVACIASLHNTTYVDIATLPITCWLALASYRAGYSRTCRRDDNHNQ